MELLFYSAHFNWEELRTGTLCSQTMEADETSILSTVKIITNHENHN